MQGKIPDGFRKCLGMLITIPLVLAVSSFAVAQNRSQTTNSSPGNGAATRARTYANSIPSPTPTPVVSSEIFKVTIIPSRTSVTRNGSYGVFADLENLSPDVVTIMATQTMLVIQPEVSQPNACVESKWGIFPARIQPTETNPQTAEVQIQPQEHYKVFLGPYCQRRVTKVMSYELVEASLRLPRLCTRRLYFYS